MLFVISGILKPGVEQQLEALSAELNEYWAQPFRALSLAGVLRDRDGARQGHLALLEADSFEHAERYLHESPFYSEGLYTRTEIAEFRVEVGRLS